MTLVAPSDYQINAGVEPGGVTVRRIRGFLSAIVPSGGGNTGAIYAVIAMHSAPGGLDFTPNTADAIISGDVLWSGCWGTETGNQLHLDIDVKSMRKLENESISLVLEGIVQSHTVSAWARALIQMP